MRVAVLSDAHGNADALETCLQFCLQMHVEQYIFLGDAVGYFPHCEAVCARLLSLPLLYVQGNHEAMVSGVLPMHAESGDMLRLPKMGLYVRRWVERCAAVGPRRLVILDGRRFMLMHGAPQNSYTGRIDDAHSIDMTDCDALLCGHTHRAMLKWTSCGKFIMNPGSCGYPRDCGTLLSLGLIDTAAMEARLYRIPFANSASLLRQVHPAVQKCLARQYDFEGTVV